MELVVVAVVEDGYARDRIRYRPHPFHVIDLTRAETDAAKVVEADRGSGIEERARAGEVHVDGVRAVATVGIDGGGGAWSFPLDRLPATAALEEPGDLGLGRNGGPVDGRDAGGGG